MRTGLAALAFGGLGVSAVCTAQPAFAQQAQRSASPADRNAIATITYQLTSRLNAEQRRGDARTRTMQRDVEAKDAALAANRAELRRVRAEGARSARRIEALENENSRLEQAAAEAKERYTAELAARDEAYARERSVLAQNAAALLETAEGRRAIDLINAGGKENWQQGRDIIARLIRLRHSVELRALAYLALDSRAKGLESVATVLDLFEQVVKEDPTVHGDSMELALLYLDVGRTREAQQAAENAVKTALSGRERARALKTMALALRMRGQQAAGVRYDIESLEILKKLLDQDPASISLRDEVADALSNVGDALVDTGDVEGARRYYKDALDRRRRLATEHPEYSANESGIAHNLSNLGHLPTATGAMCDLPSHLQSLQIRARQAAAERERISSQALHSIGLATVGRCMAALGNPKGALEYLKQSLAIARQISAVDTQSGAAQGRLASALLDYGEALEDSGDEAAALSQFEESAETIQRLVRQGSVSAGNRSVLAMSLERNGDVLLNRNDIEGASAKYQQALATRDSVPIDPEDVILLSSLAGLLNKLVEVRSLLHDFAGSAAYNRRSLTLWRSLAGGRPSDIELQEELALALHQQGALLRYEEQPRAAVAPFKESLAITRRLADRDPASALYQRNIASLLWTLATLGADGHSWADVVRQLESMRGRGLLQPGEENALEEARAKQRGSSP